MNEPLANAPRAVMYTYPWDLYEQGIDDSLRLMKECGIDAVQLAFSYHVATFLHPRNPKRRIRFGEHGALHFDPLVLPADAWPFIPPVAAEVEGRRYLTELLEAISSYGLQAIAWVVYLYNHTLARARPELVVRNAYGDPSGAQLCPANPVVRDFARALTRAVTLQQPLTGFVCESLSYLPYDYGFLNYKAAVVPEARVRLLLGLCFCEHCSEEARLDGIAVNELRHEMCQKVDEHLALLPDTARHEEDHQQWSQSAFDGKLWPFLRTRERIASSLQSEVMAAASSCGLRVGTTAAEGQDERITGVPETAVRDKRDELRVELFPGMQDESAGQFTELARERAGQGRPIYGLVQLSRFSDEREFLATVKQAHELGVSHFRIYQFGLLTWRQMDWLRRASPFWSNGGRATRA